MEVRHFEEGYYTHPEIVALMQKVQVQVGNEPEHRQAGPGMPTAVVEVDLHSGATLRMKQGFNAARAAYLRTKGQDEKLRPMAEACSPRRRSTRCSRACAPWMADIRDVLPSPGTLGYVWRARARPAWKATVGLSQPVGKRCMHLDGRELRGCHRQPREMRQGPRRHLTRRTCRTAPTDHQVDTACLRLAKYDSVARRKPARRLACSVSFILADLRLDATMPVRLPWNWV